MWYWYFPIAIPRLVLFKIKGGIGTDCTNRTHNINQRLCNPLSAYQLDTKTKIREHHYVEFAENKTSFIINCSTIVIFMAISFYDER
nr:MAG TPA: hypothetical protein [Caudoviricetes sp.]